MRRDRLSRAATLCLLALLTACGEDETARHGLRAGPLESTPHGEAVAVRYEADDGAVYVARIQMRTRYWQKSAGGPRPGEDRGQGSVVLELRQTFARSDPARAPRSRIRLACVEADGKNAEAFLAREPITGVLEHDADGRPRPRSLRLEGGTQGERGEALDMLGTLLFAGFGGSPSWLPPRPVRAGEAWRLEDFVQPRGVDNAQRQAERLGASAPEPTFSGTARLERVTAGPDGALLEVALDALIEIDGPFSKEGRGGRMSVGDRQRGRAVISAPTGLPVRFEMTHTGRTEVRSGGEHVEQEFVVEVEGEVLQAEGGKAPGGG